MRKSTSGFVDQKKNIQVDVLNVELAAAQDTFNINALDKTLGILVDSVNAHVLDRFLRSSNFRHLRDDLNSEINIRREELERLNAQ